MPHNFGNNHKAMGGHAGLGAAMAVATEFQGDGTPHGHGFLALHNMFQFNDLEEIAAMLEKNIHNIDGKEMVERVKQFIEHVQCEDHINHEEHQESLGSLEQQFHHNNFGPKENAHLSVRCTGMHKRTSEVTVSAQTNTGAAQGNMAQGSTGTAQTFPAAHGSTGTAQTDTIADIMQDAKRFRAAFEADVQFVVSRVQHHWHLLDKDGKRAPMRYCAMKGRRKATCCKRGFPKAVTKIVKNKFAESKYRTRIVCAGVASELDLKVSGRRNMLGACVCRRRCPWLASHSRLMAHLTRSNSNIQCPYRLPINEITHDEDCTRKRCQQFTSTRRLTIVAQRAMKTITGYFGGYISKRQKVGNFEIRASVKALPLLFEKLRRREYKSGSVQMAHMTNRMFSTLESKGILRMSTEETMLASLHKANDPLAAEFIRTFRHEFFFGRQLLQRYEHLRDGGSAQTVSLLVPKHPGPANATDFASLYGFRPCHPDVFFLSPWEFCQWFSGVSLRAPSASFELAKWTKAGAQKIKAGNTGNLQPLIDYEFDDAMLHRINGFYRFPTAAEAFKGRAPEIYLRFRSLWCLQKRLFPLVPCPEGTPLPNRRVPKETRAKIFSIYLRPWTLIKGLADETVPFITDLAELEAVGSSEDGNNPEPSARLGWRRYLSNVLPHAARGIRSFMLTCLAEGRGGDDEDEKDRRKGADLLCHLSLEAVHAALTLRTRTTKEEEQSQTERLVIRTAQQAARLSQLSGTRSSSGQVTVENSISRLHREVPPHPSAQEEIPDLTMAASMDVSFVNEWEARYDTWYEKVYISADTHTPTPKQQHVLQTLHDRMVKEHYEILQEDYAEVWRSKPDDVQVEEPLLRLIHGLPGSGKSQLLLWHKEYFEEVWQWELNNQFAIVAPQNAMADNVGGGTMHSFGGIAFKDRRGVLVNTGGFMDDE